MSSESEATLTRGELLNSIEAKLKSTMPEGCYNMFKKFTLCKSDVDSEIIKTKGLNYYQEYITEPFSRIDGCKNEFNSYSKCYYDFHERYIDLKNYTAEIEGKKAPFDRKEMEKDKKKYMTTYNFGLNKF